MNYRFAYQHVHGQICLALLKDDGGLLFALAIVTFSAAAGVLWIRRGELPFIGARLTSPKLA
jgi:hypothetical protein